MRKIIVLILVISSFYCNAQNVTVLGPKGKIETIDTASSLLNVASTYLSTPCDTCIGFDSSKVVTSVISIRDSFRIYKGGIWFSSLPKQTSVDSLRHLYIDTSVRRDAYVLSYDSTNRKYYFAAPGSGGGGSTAISALTAATATNSINNLNYKQTWNWNTLPGDTGLLLRSLNTLAASNGQVLFGAALSGANGTSAQTTKSLWVSNTKTGTTSTNIGLYSTVSGGATNNWSGLFDAGNLLVNAGNLGIGTGTTTAPQWRLDVNGTASSYLMNVGTDVTAGTGWVGMYLGESFGSSAVHKTGFAYLREGTNSAQGGGSIFVISNNVASNTNAAINNTNDIHTSFNQDRSVIIGNGNNPVTASILTVVSSTRGVLLPRTSTTGRDLLNFGVLTGTISAAGSGYTNTTASYSLTGGSGSGATATITTAGGLVTVVVISAPGQNYVVGDVLSATIPSGSGFTYTVSTISGSKDLILVDTTQHSLLMNNGKDWQGAFTSSSAGTLTLRHGGDYVFTGTTATYTLPAVNSTFLGRSNGIKIKNRGSGTITLNSNAGSTIYDTAAQSTINITAGQGIELMPDGTYFLVMYKQ